MGLTSWRKGSRGKIMPSDVTIAKNYLGKKELDHLNRIVNMYLDYAELQAVRKRPMYMRDWVKKLNAFLKFSEYEILTDAGKSVRELLRSWRSRNTRNFAKFRTEIIFLILIGQRKSI